MLSTVAAAECDDLVAVAKKEQAMQQLLRTLLTHLDVDVSRVVAVGDGENDLGMLRLVGRGVAMGNAGAKVKAAARETLVATNDEDGVA